MQWLYSCTFHQMVQTYNSTKHFCSDLALSQSIFSFTSGHSSESLSNFPVSSSLSMATRRSLNLSCTRCIELSKRLNFSITQKVKHFDSSIRENCFSTFTLCGKSSLRPFSLRQSRTSGGGLSISFSESYVQLVLMYTKI